MRFVTFSTDNTPRLGLLAGGEVVDVTSLHPALGSDMGRLLGLCTDEPEFARNAIEASPARHALAEVRLLAPVLAPRKFVGVAANYGSFVAAARRLNVALPAQQVWFSRPLCGVIGPGQAIHAPRNSVALDYEGELAIVVGKRCRGVPRALAHTVIAGYTISNDVTVRDWAARTPLLGKSFDTHAPIGPCIVTTDELGDPQDLALKTWINDELRQSGRTSDMLSDCHELVETLSAVCTLEPGDIIITGTPDGCGVLFAPPRFIRPGDVVKIEIEGIGTLSNRVVVEPDWTDLTYQGDER